VLFNSPHNPSAGCSPSKNSRSSATFA
jgi:hypothetical protein